MVKTTNPQMKFNLAVAALLASFAAVAFGLYYLNSIAGNVRMSKVKIAEIKRDVSLLDKIADEQKLYGADIQKVKSTLPSQYYEISFFTSELERLAQENGVALIINADKKKKEEKEKYDSIIYSLEITGSYSSVAQFLSRMSKLPYHTSVDYIKMSTEDGRLITDVKFRLFVEK